MNACLDFITLTSQCQYVINLFHQYVLRPPVCTLLAKLGRKYVIESEVIITI